ncbi:MAG: hypothetical protein JST78_12085 [Bacteroidetes bacterium]|nr:hypothetical protein [Bacteroidota bacterium]
MKKLTVLFIMALGIFASCVPYPEENPDPVAPVGDLEVDFDGSHFTSVTTSVVLNDNSLTIKGVNEAGAYFKIIVPEAPLLGTYTLDVVPGLVLEYNQNNGSDSYIAAKDDTGPFASFADYVNTAQLVITQIDRVHKRISGTFKFTGVRFADALHTAVNTKVFTNGTFTNLPYTATEVVDPNETILVKKIVNNYPGSGIADQTAEYTYSGNKMVKEVYTDSQGLQSTTTYTYSNDNITLIEEREGNDLVFSESFVYNSNNKLVTYIAVDTFDETSVKETYVHNPDGSISVTRFTGDLTSQTQEDGTSTIYFVGGEVDHITFSSGNTITYTYDSKNNPFKNVLGFDKIAFVNGEAKGISKNITQSSGATPDLTITYTYNNNNYPATSTLPEVVSTYSYE